MTDGIHHAWIEGESTLVIGEPIRCVCGGGADIVAVKPGHDAERWAPGGFVVARGTADVGWCMECFSRKFGVSEVAA